MKFLCLFGLLLIALLSSCDDKVIEPISPKLDGSYSNVSINCDSIEVNINYSGSSYNSYTGSSSYNYDKSSVWVLNEKIINTDSSSSKITDRALTFNYSLKLIGYNCWVSKDIKIIFKPNVFIIDSIIANFKSYNQNEPQHMSRLAYSSSSNGFVLTNIPYSTNSNGDILIDLKGKEIFKYSPTIISSSIDFASDYGTTGSSSSTNNTKIKSIVDILPECKFHIVIKRN